MHLTDFFMELFAFVSHFLKTVQVKQPPFEQVRGTVVRLLARSETCVKQGKFPREDFDQARFAICAWVDEMLLSSPWEQKHLWLREQLQRTYFSTTGAGEEFFERLDGLGSQQREVREVYYLCLVLGFAGRFCEAGDQYQLEQLKTANLKLLLGSSRGLPPLDGELFPEAHCADYSGSVTPKPRRAFPLQMSACLAGPVLVFAVMLLIYHFILNSIVENFLKTVAG